MKNTVKALSFILTAVTLMSSAATMASAGNIWKNEDMLGNAPSACTETVKKDTSSSKHHFLGSVTETSAKKNNGSGLFVQKADDNKCNVFEEKCIFNKPCGLYGAKYYTKADAQAAIEEYFKANTYDIYMTEGQSKTFCEDAYFYSDTPDVAYYDYRNGTIVAEGNGSAEVYVYTKGGVPFFKLNVYVSRKFSNTKENPTLTVTPDEWRLDVGEKTGFTVTSSDGKEYDDIVLSVKLGAKRVELTQVTNELTAKKNGAVVVYAYSKSNPDICGETILYIGQYEYMIREGCWNYDKDCIKVNDWYCGWSCDYDFYSCVTGWIKSAEGIFIPVVKLKDAVVDDDGTLRDTTIATFGKVSYLDLLRDAYGDKELMASIIEKYNLYKYGFWFEDGKLCGKIDPRYFYMSQLFN